MILIYLTCSDLLLLVSALEIGQRRDGVVELKAFNL